MKIRLSISAIVSLVTACLFATAAWAVPSLGVNSGHGGVVMGFSWSGDRALLASWANDGSIRVWHQDSGRLLKILTFDGLGTGYDGSDTFRSAALARDGRFVAASSQNGAVRVWRLADEKLLFTTRTVGAAASTGVTVIDGHVQEIAFSLSGKLVAFARPTGLSVYDVSSLASVGQFAALGPPSNVGGVVFANESAVVVKQGDGYAQFTLGRKVGAEYAGNGAALFEEDKSQGEYHFGSDNFSRSGTVGELHKPSGSGTKKAFDYVKPDLGYDYSVSTQVFDARQGVLAAGTTQGEVLLTQPWSPLLAPMGKSVERIGAIDVSPAGSILVGLRSGAMALWDLSRLRSRFYRRTGDNTITGVALSPDGSRAAVAGDAAVTVVDARSGDPLARLRDAVWALGFDPTGRRLAFGTKLGKLIVQDQTASGARTSIFENRVFTALAHGSDNPGCFSVTYSPDGTLILTGGGDSTTKLWDAKTGKNLWTAEKSGEYMATFSRDGALFAIDGTYDLTARIFDARSRRLVTSFPTKAELGAIAFSPTGDRLYVGYRTGQIEARNVRDGKVVSSFKAHGGTVSGLGFTRVKGEDLLVSAGHDGALKLWRSDQLIASAFVFTGGDWALVTADGYWDASAKGGSLVSMIEGLRAYGIDQFAARNNRPDIIAERFGLPAELVAVYREQYLKRLRRLGLQEAGLTASGSFPTAAITKTVRDGAFVEVRLSFTAAGSDLSRYQIYVNDVPLYAQPGRPLKGRQATAKERIELVPGDNKIEVSCMDASGAESYRVPASQHLDGKTAPDLYYLAFGVSDYADARIPDLAFAAKDATDLGAAFAAMEGKGFRQVKTKVLTDRQVTRASLLGAKAFLKKARPQDAVVLFVAGHGMQLASAGEGYTYYYLTADAQLADPARASVPFERIEELLQGIAPRQKLVLMDSCESGELDEAAPRALALSGARGLKARAIPSTTMRGLQVASRAASRVLEQRDRFIFNDLVRRTGAIVFSSSRADEASLEAVDWKQGAFTYTILRALADKAADKNKDGALSVAELRDYVSAAVPKLVKTLDPRAEQHPVVDRDNIAVDFAFPASR